MGKLTVTFLGTSAGTPSRRRGLAGMVIQRSDEVLLLDAGDGVLRQAVTMDIELNRKLTIVITHLHGDHVAGLFGLLWAMTLADRTEPLTIVAPSSLRKWLDTTCEILRTGLGLAFTIRFIRAKRGVVLRLPTIEIRAERASHSIESYAYVVEERSRRRRRVGYSGDTRPSKSLARFFSGCNLLICESTYSTVHKNLALKNRVSTSVEAATIAAEAHVKRLVLTHFSTRYDSTYDLVREARPIFRNTLAAHDGMCLQID